MWAIAHNIASASVNSHSYCTSCHRHANCPDSLKEQAKRFLYVCCSKTTTQIYIFYFVFMQTCCIFHIFIKIQSVLKTLFRSTRGMEQVEHTEQDSPIMPMLLFHLFRLFHTRGGTEQNKAAIKADISVPLVPLVPHRGWNGTEQGRWFGPIDTAAPRPLQEKDTVLKSKFF